VTVLKRTRYNRLIDMVDPRVGEVDFFEICRTLSVLPRYNGACDCTIAYHSLLVYELADPSVKPWALVHDFHEERIGDITTPAKLAIAAMAQEIADAGAWIVTRAIDVLKHKHDLAIWKAAGLEPPTHEQEKLIKIADQRAYATEKQIFMGIDGREGLTVTGAAEYDVDSADGFDADSFGFSQVQIAYRLFEVCLTVLPTLRPRKAA
jgi:hypothetical protein